MKDQIGLGQFSILILIKQIAFDGMLFFALKTPGESCAFLLHKLPSLSVFFLRATILVPESIMLYFRHLYPS